MKFQKIKGVKHLVFDDRAEFLSFYGDRAPSIVDDWRDGQEGDWVEADDGGIVQILRRGELPHPHDRGNDYSYHDGWVRTVVGTFPVNKVTTMDTDFDLHPDRYRFGGATNEQYELRSRVRKNLTKKERIFVNCLKAGHHPQAAYESAYGPNVRWREKVSALFKRERIVQEMNEAMSRAIEELGLDLKWILFRIMDLAENSKSDRDKLSALKELGEILRLKEDSAKQITTGEVKFFPEFGSSDPIAQIEAEKVETLSKLE